VNVKRQVDEERAEEAEEETLAVFREDALARLALN
jgi:hypothetical protein